MAKPKIEPVVWRAPDPPPRARRDRGDEPFPPMSLLGVPGVGPEDVVVDDSGRLLTGLADGRIVRLGPDGGDVEIVADTGGRPLGLEVLPDGDIVVCDSHRGVLRLDPRTGALVTLVDQVDGRPLRFASNAVVARDGTIYFTESTSRFHFEHWKAAIFEHTPAGSLFRLAPDGSVETIATGLQFANGVVLTPDEDAVIVAETGSYQLTTVPLTGSRAGQPEPFVANLPGSPDNLSVSPDGRTIWVALASARDPRLDFLLRTPPLLRKLAWSIPERFQPAVRRTTWVLGIDFAGSVVRDLQGPGDRFGMATSAREHGGRLYCGTVLDAAIAVVDL